MCIGSICNACCRADKAPISHENKLAPQQESFQEYSLRTKQLTIVNPTINPQITNIALLYAIKSHDLPQVNALLSSNINVNFIYNDNTPLTYAISLQEGILEKNLFTSESIIRRLLEAKASPHTCLPLLNAMHIKSEPRTIQIINWLLAASVGGPNSSYERLLEQRDHYGQTPLIWAVAYNHLNIVGLLLQHRADVNGCDHDKNTPLIHAARLRSPNTIISELLHARADVNACMVGKKTPLYYAKKNKDSMLYYHLISFGARETLALKPAPAAFPYSEGGRVLIHVIENDDISGVENLLHFGVPVNYADQKGETALVRAIKHHPIALERGQEKINQLIITTLLKARASPNLSTALISAVRISPESTSFWLIEKLLEASVNLEPILGTLCLLSRNDREGKTALIWAVSQGYLQCTALLIQARANVHARDCRQNTPLLYAAKMKNFPLMSLLVQAGADITTPNLNGETVFDEPPRKCKIRFKKEVDLEDVLEIDSGLYSSEVHQIAKNLFHASQIDPHKTCHYFLKWTLTDAIEEALSVTKNPQEATVLAKECLLKIIEKNYASVTEFFTEEQVEDVLEQQTRLRHTVKTPKNYDYAEYDQESIESAITAYSMNQRVSFTPEFKYTYQYPVIRHRMPGQNSTQEDYKRLYDAATQIDHNPSSTAR